MMILGLDIAQTTGYAIIKDKDTLIESGTIRIKLAGEPEIDKSQFKTFRLAFLELIDKHKPDMIILESIFVGPDPRKSATLNQQRGVIIEATPTSIKLVGSYLSRVRMNVLGAGKKHDKREVFEWAVAKFKLKDFKFTKNNDETDAMLLAVWGFLL